VSRRLGLVEIREGEPRPADLALNASEWIARWAADKHGGFNESLARKELGRQLGMYGGGSIARLRISAVFWPCSLCMEQASVARRSNS